MKRAPIDLRVFDEPDYTSDTGQLWRRIEEPKSFWIVRVLVAPTKDYPTQLPGVAPLISAESILSGVSFALDSGDVWVCYGNKLVRWVQSAAIAELIPKSGTGIARRP